MALAPFILRVKLWVVPVRLVENLTGALQKTTYYLFIIDVDK